MDGSSVGTVTVLKGTLVAMLVGGQSLESNRRSKPCFSFIRKKLKAERPTNGPQPNLQ